MLSPPLNHACAWLISVTLAMGTPSTDLSSRQIAASTGSPGSHALSISSTSADLASSSTGVSGYSPSSPAAVAGGRRGSAQEGGGGAGAGGGGVVGVVVAFADASFCVSDSPSSSSSTTTSPTAAGSGGAETTPALAAAALEASSRALEGLTCGGRGWPGYQGLSREERGDDDELPAALSAKSCSGGIEGARGLRGGLPDRLLASPAPRSLIVFDGASQTRLAVACRK